MNNLLHTIRNSLPIYTYSTYQEDGKTYHTLQFQMLENEPDPVENYIQLSPVFREHGYKRTKAFIFQENGQLLFQIEFTEL